MMCWEGRGKTREARLSLNKDTKEQLLGGIPQISDTFYIHLIQFPMLKLLGFTDPIPVFLGHSGHVCTPPNRKNVY